MSIIRSRPRWRVTAAAAIAGAAILAPAVALAASSSPAHARAPQVAACGATTTYVWIADAPNGAAGHIAYPVEFTNLGAHSCWLVGYPGVAGVTGSGHGIGPAAGRIQVTAHKVTIKPRQTAHALLIITDRGFITGCHQATGAGLAVYPPNQKRRQLVFNFTFPACKNKAYMNLLPVTAGIGVP